MSFTPTVKKWRQGSVIKNADEVYAKIEYGMGLYFGDRWYHISWIASMQFRCVMGYIRQGRLRHAIPNQPQQASAGRQTPAILP